MPTKREKKPPVLKKTETGLILDQESKGESDKKIFVIKAGGKQYVVSSGDQIWVEKIDKFPKDVITFDDLLGKGKVEAEVGETKKSVKISILKYKPKTGYKKRIGHRQLLTSLKIL